jgi:hypothetical protein
MMGPDGIMGSSSAEALSVPQIIFDVNIKVQLHSTRQAEASPETYGAER